MEENLKSKLGFFTFLFIILALLVGGFIYTKYVIKNKDNVKDDNKVLASIKEDKSKDYFYYENESVISESAEIYYKDIKINIKDTEELNRTLNNENIAFKDNIKYIKDELANGNLLTDELCTYKNDDIFSLKFRDYKDYEAVNYVSLVLKDYDYTCFDSITFSKVRAYVFDKKTGEIVKDEDLLKKYKVNMAIIKKAVQVNLESKQTAENVILIEDTINNLDNASNYALYVDEFGNLCISYLVKTSEVDYNEDMEVSL